MLDLIAISLTCALCRFFFSASFFPRDGKHKLDAIHLIYFARSRVAIQGDNIAVGVSLPQSVHDSLAGDVVGEAPKGLKTNNIHDSVIG